MAFPSFHQWKRIPKVLNQKEKISLAVLIIIFLGSFILFLGHTYVKNSEIQPVHKGTYIEGVVGEPRFINSVYANNDTDRDLMELILSGLMKYNLNGELVPDLAKDYKVSDDKKTYDFFLRENVFWHNGKKFSADDVIFTIQTIQNTDYKSLIRANWLGVEIEKISDYEIKFKLRNPYQGFLDRLTLKIIPKHIWESSSPQNFPLSLYNLQAVGTGPYQVKKLKQGKTKKIISLELSRNQKYFGKSPYLSKIIFRFFDNENELKDAANKKKIDGFSISLPKDYSSFEKDFKKYSFSMPRYFAIFLNQDNYKFFEIKDIRKAIRMAVDKKEIKEKILFNSATIVNSPLLSQVYGFQLNDIPCEFNIEKAKEILEKNGFELNNSGKRVKIIDKKPLFEFKSRIELGSKGKEVTELQKCLAKDSEIYPEGNISGYFGQKTKKAVIRFQEKYKKDILEPCNIKKGTGVVAGKTREKLNKLYFSQNKEIIPLKFSLITVEDQTLKQVAELLKEQWGKIGVEVEIGICP
ncbi:MAG: ABC transporter substrate-binding protein, partial [Patescibacteria group bacterium]|nr:ABC transporter substrate-binding protein [Patescibacteria group bacterium]